MDQMHIEMAAINKMLKADHQTAKTLGDDEARFLVDAYYITQDARIRAAGQVRAMSANNEPHLVLQWLLEQNEALENEIKKALDIYSKNHLVGDWMRGISGIGPVIAAGFLAHIDIHKAPTVGHIWSFAGLDGTAMWMGGAAAEKCIAAFVNEREPVTADSIMQVATALNGSAKWLVRRTIRAATGADIPMMHLENSISDRDYVELILSLHGNVRLTKKNVIDALSKRAWNANLKTLCWKLGESFVKVSGNEKAFYGRIYKERKDLEIANNERKAYAGQATHKLETTRIGKDTEAYGAYSQGKLPPAHIHARAKRYAVKLFLSHLHHVWYVREFKVAPPNPYPIAHMGHAHHLLPPNFTDLN